MAYSLSNYELNDLLFGPDAEHTPKIPQVRTESDPEFLGNEPSPDYPPSAPTRLLTDTTEYRNTYRLSQEALDPNNSDRAVSAGYFETVNGQKIAVRVTAPLFPVAREHKKVIIKCTPWSNGVNDDTDTAEAVSLAAQGARVISVGIMGMDKGSSKLTRRQRRALKKGDFGPVAEAQMAAALQAYRHVFFADNKKQALKKITVWGASQGGSRSEERRVGKECEC